MALDTVEDCIKEGLIEFIPNRRDMEKESRSCLLEADDRLESAETFFKIKKFKYAIVAGYDAMEFAARAALALKGVKPRMHKCIFLYLEKEFAATRKLDREFPGLIMEAFNTSKQAHYIAGRTIAESMTRSFLDRKVNPFVEEMKKLLKT